MYTPIKSLDSDDGSLYHTYSPEDIMEKSRFISEDLNGRTISKESITGDLNGLHQRLLSSSSDKTNRGFEIQKILRELDEYKLAEVNKANDSSINNQFYRIKTQAIALSALDVYEASGGEEFPEDSVFERIEQLQTLRSPGQVVWDCVFGSDAKKALKLRAKKAEALAKSILSYEQSNSTLQAPLIPTAEEYFRTSSMSSNVSAKDVEMLETFERSKSFIERMGDCLFFKHNVKKAIAIAKALEQASSFDPTFVETSPMNKSEHRIRTL